MSESIVNEWEIIKQNPNPKISFLDDIYVERGTKEDWLKLEALHYKNGGSIPAGSHYYVLKHKDDLIGVVMMISPKLLLKERHIVFPRLKSGNDTKLTNSFRTDFINQNITVVGRVVVDTMYRGVGLAYRFVNIAARMDKKRFVEIQSSMSKYNEFAHKAGFAFVPEMKATHYDKGVRFFRKTFKANPVDLEAILEELDAYPESIKNKKIHEVREFYRMHSMMETTGKASLVTKNGYFGEQRLARLSTRTIIGNLQQLILASPLYGIYENPDWQTELPKKINISAFDKQPPKEKLKL